MKQAAAALSVLVAVGAGYIGGKELKAFNDNKRVIIEFDRDVKNLEQKMWSGQEPSESEILEPFTKHENALKMGPMLYNPFMCRAYIQDRFNWTQTMYKGFFPVSPKIE